MVAGTPLPPRSLPSLPPCDRRLRLLLPKLSPSVEDGPRILHRGDVEEEVRSEEIEELLDISEAGVPCCPSAKEEVDGGDEDRLQSESTTCSPQSTRIQEVFLSTLSGREPRFL